ncbi:MAG TPA: hypothetical protein VHA15_07795, partial [Burkholderiales bacterium]|nr:hypothetical protein [Burkholderiales bacterium]
MSNRLHVAIAMVIACAGFGMGAFPATAADRLENIPLEWKPTSPMSERGPLDLKGIEGAKLQIEPFVDTRENPGFIGQNRDRI